VSVRITHAIIDPETGEVLAEVGAIVAPARAKQLVDWFGAEVMVHAGGHYTLADRFNYGVHGQVVGSYCPLLDQPCAEEMAGRCPLSDPEDCSSGEGGYVVTAHGFAVPDPHWTRGSSRRSRRVVVKSQGGSDG
jgi:hypothetical protein